MKENPTLADAVIRESLRPHNKLIPKRLGKLVAQARKFVLDTEASRFLSDLAHASYIGKRDGSKDIIEQVRQLARIPHSITWIEYDHRAFRYRTEEAYPSVQHYETERTEKGLVAKPSDSKAVPDDISKQIGWLLEEFGETLFVVTFFAEGSDGSVVTMPHSIAWTTDSSVPPIQHSTITAGASDSYLATGIHGYDIPNVVIGTVPEINLGRDITTRMVVEMLGELRFVWALLAAINDIPIGLKHVSPTKGFVARGRYRKFVEHSVISILIPKGRDPQKIARKVVELSRRRAHMVRGHWRRDYRHEGNRIWVKEHQRGDASLGFVTHDYQIKHEEA